MTEPRPSTTPHVAVPRWRLGLVAPEPGGSAWRRQRTEDPVGYRLHLWAASIGLAMLTLPTSVMEFALLPVAIVSLIRAPRLVHAWGALLLQPHMLAIGVWLLVGGVSYAWAPDRSAWLDEFGVARFALLPLLIWPVLADRNVLLRALLLGLLIGVGVQATHLAGVRFGIEAIDWGRKPGRVSGWWDPVVGGSLLTGGLGLCVGWAITRRGLTRVGIGALVLITLAGITLTGTRGAWLASLGVLTIGGLWFVLAPSHADTNGRARWRGLLLVGVGAAVLGAGVWLAAGARIADRARAGYDEVAQAIEDRDFRSDTGMRLLLNAWAFEAFTQEPIAGVGAGGYRSWCADHAEAEGLAPDRYTLHGHAHNAYLHALATRGLLGAAGLGAGLALVLLGAVRGSTRCAPVAMALVGRGCVGVFDCVQVNQQTAAMLFALVGLAPAWIPIERPSDRDP